MSDLEKMAEFLGQKNYDIVTLAEFTIATERKLSKLVGKFDISPYTYLKVGNTGITFRFDSKGRLKGLE